MSEFIKVTGYKVDVQKTAIFLNVSLKQILKFTCSRAHRKRNTVIGLKKKCAGCLCSKLKNNKEIKEDLNRDIYYFSGL